jgi:hypothetical protein
MATGRVPTTANSPLTAKGDLFGYSTTQARVPVGNDGETLVADSSTSTGLRYQTGVNRNITVNGGADIWQRGTSISTGAAFVYTADRWRAGRGGFAAGTTISRQPTNDTTNLPNIQYCIRWQRDSGNTSTADMRLGINFETIESIPFAGQTVVFSYYARKSSTWTDANSTSTVLLYSGTGTDEGTLPSGTYTGNATVATSNALLTTTWQRFTATGTVSASATQLGFYIDWLPVGTAGASDYMEITGLQLELGTVPTVFKRAGGTIQGELSACMRYFQKSYDQSVAPGTASADSGSVVAYFASNVGNGSPFAWTKLHQTMRTVPTLTIYAFGGGTTRVSDNNNTDLAANSGTVTRTGEGGFGLYNNSGGTIAPGNNGFRFQWTGSAEL